MKHRPESIFLKAVVWAIDRHMLVIVYVSLQASETRRVRKGGGRPQHV